MNDDTITRARAAVARLREAEAGATPGPWRAEHRGYGCTADDDEVSGLGLEIDGPPEPLNRGQFARGADARVIADGRNALPALLALAEAVGRLAEEGGAGEWWYYLAPGWSDSIPSCIGCGELDWRVGELNAGHGRDCPALAIDAALADLAALAGDADAGGIAQTDPDGGVHHLRNMSDIVRDAGEVQP